MKCRHAVTKSVTHTHARTHNIPPHCFSPSPLVSGPDLVPSQLGPLSVHQNEGREEHSTVIGFHFSLLDTSDHLMHRPEHS